MLLYECPGFLRVSYIEGADYICFEWEDFSIRLPDLKKAHAIALEAALGRGCLRYVAQCARARDSLLPEAVIWWRKTWAPRLIEAGISRIVTVVPSSTLAEISNRSWQREIDGSLEIVNVRSVAEAEAQLGPSPNADRSSG